MAKAAGKTAGRKSLFGTKSDGARVSGVVTAQGSVRFELHRRKLAKLAGLDPEQISDGDVVEYMARGEDEARRFFRARA